MHLWFTCIFESEQETGVRMLFSAYFAAECDDAAPIDLQTEVRHDFGKSLFCRKCEDVDEKLVSSRQVIRLWFCFILATREKNGSEAPFL